MADILAQHAISLPAPALRALISHYVGVRADARGPCTHAGTPSRHAHLIISFSEPIELLRPPCGAIQSSGAFTALVAGLHDSPALVRMASQVHLVHVFFTPLGVRAILGISNLELASRVVELSDLWGSRVTHLVDQLSSSTSWPARFAQLDDAFGRALQPHAMSDRVIWAWHRLVRSSGRIPIASLAREVGWTRSHLTESFRNTFGFTPKTAARIFRFERACHALTTAPRHLADLARSCGYFDQAHMTREWQTLAGCSPGQWIANELPFLLDGDAQPPSAVPESA